MAFFDDIFTFIQTQAGITAIVADRVHPIVLPEKPILPAIVFDKISRLPEYSHDGDSSLGNARYQFSTWSITHAESVAIADQLVLSFSGKKQTMGATPEVTSFISNEQDDQEAETSLYRQIVDIDIWH